MPPLLIAFAFLFIRRRCYHYRFHFRHAAIDVAALRRCAELMLLRTCAEIIDDGYVIRHFSYAATPRQPVAAAIFRHAACCRR